MTKPLTPCPRCEREIDEQSVCIALNCPVLAPATRDDCEIIDAYDRCANCDSEFENGAALEEIRDFWGRVSPGDMMPSGGCPNCGAFCFPIPDDEPRIDFGDGTSKPMNEAADMVSADRCAQRTERRRGNDRRR